MIPKHRLGMGSKTVPHPPTKGEPKEDIIEHTALLAHPSVVRLESKGNILSSSVPKFPPVSVNNATCLPSSYNVSRMSELPDYLAIFVLRGFTQKFIVFSLVASNTLIIL